MDRERRIGLNEALFRQVNERIKDVNDTFSVLTGVGDFVCECGDGHCAERLTMTMPDYERLRSDPTTFAVLPGHEKPDVEDVVARYDAFWVVRKAEGVPEDIAVQTDPR